MLIKRVVIQGFKTFAKRTEFVFDPGVTAIVGPNGSGKSNVVDAIRWCLGEQSFGLLRSKKTSDVIFSGSDQKARLGMAQVSISLDNANGELPVDFAEIEVTRRAYRDGDNEYLLNGRRVRLQDITELLAQTGLGKRTYAVIGQGLIDKVLSLAPEELRSLFEEAAGITGYQHKRATTIRRLDATQLNLTRVQDVLGELSPRLGYLRKQAERAREREQLAKDLRDMLRDWYGYHWHRTLSELTQGHLAAEALHSKVEAEQKLLTGLAQRVEQSRAQQGQLRGQLGELHRESSGLHRDAEQFLRELAVGQERLSQLQARQEAARQELVPLRLQHDTTSRRIDELGEAVKQSRQAYTALAEIVASLQQEVDQRQRDRRAHQDLLASARVHVEKTQQELADATSRRREIEQRAQNLEQEQGAAIAAEEATQAEAAAWQLKLDQAMAELVDLETAQEQAQSQLVHSIATRTDLRGQLDEAQVVQQEAERASDRLQTRHDLLNRLQQEGAGYASGVRAVLQATRPDAPAKQGAPLQGIVGTVATLIRVPANLDKAIETALGGAIQNVVTEQWRDTQAAIDFLKRTGHGRATFLPLDRLSVLPMIAAPKRDGVLGNAAELVDNDPSVDAAVQQLLNRVWVVDTLQTARAALDAHRGQSRPTVVTLDGDIVRPGGAVTGGSDQTRRDESMFARERELRELPALVRQANLRLQQATEARANLAGQDEQMARTIATAESELAAIALRDRRHREQLEETRRQFERVQQSAGWRLQRSQQIAAELAELAQRQTEVAALLQSLDVAQAEAHTQLVALDAAIAETTADEILRQLGDQRAAAAQAEAAWQNRRSLIDEQERTLQQTYEQIATKERLVAQLSAEEAILSEQLQELAAREVEQGQAIAQVQRRIDPAEHRLNQLEAGQALLETQERQAQEQLRRSETAWNAAQLHFQRTDDQVQQLRHAIEQDLGLVLLEVGDDLAYQPPLPWDTVVEQIPPRTELSEGLEDEIRAIRARLSRVANVNPDAPREYAEATGRHDYLLTQSADLEAAIADLRKILHELDEVMQTELARTFAAVAEQFVLFFQQLFNGGSAKLVLADPEDIANSGIEIIALASRQTTAKLGAAFRWRTHPGSLCADLRHFARLANPVLRPG